MLRFRRHAVGSAARSARAGRNGSSACSAQRRRPPGRRRSTSTRPTIATSSPPKCPGLAREQIDLALEDTRLTIRGRATRRPSAAGRAVPLPPGRARPRRLLAHLRVRRRDRQSSAITADLNDGVLTVTLPKVADRAAAHASRSSDVRRSRLVCRCSFVIVAASSPAGPDRPDAHRRGERRGADRRAAGAAAARPGAARADRRRRCPTSPASPQRAITSVTNISSTAGRPHAELAVRQRSVLPLLLRRPDDAFGSREPASRRASAPASIVSRRRLRPHQQPRRRRRTAPRSRSRCPTSASCGPRSSASTRRPTSRC